MLSTFLLIEQESKHSKEKKKKKKRIKEVKYIRLQSFKNEMADSCFITTLYFISGWRQKQQEETQTQEKGKRWARCDRRWKGKEKKKVTKQENWWSWSFSGWRRRLSETRGGRLWGTVTLSLIKKCLCIGTTSLKTFIKNHKNTCFL